MTAQDPPEQPGPGAAAPSGDQPPSPGPALPGSGQAWLRGRFATRYWGRWAGSTSDHDVLGTLSLDLGDPEQDRVTGHFMGRLAWDLDGAEPDSSPFFSLNDTWNDDVTGYVYDAYADVHRVTGFSLLRAGRQPIYETPEFAYFDGVRAESVEVGAIGLKVGAYGGLSTHLYESSRRGDWTLGAFAQVRPAEATRMRFDWMHLEDETRSIEHEDDLFGVALWQRITERLRIEARYSRIESRDRDVRALVGYVLPERDLVANLTYYQLLRTQRDLVLELDPFFQSLREYRPFWQLGASVGKGLSQHVHLDLGADVRRVVDASDEGTFNRDYERWFATLGLQDLWAPDLSLNVTADLWRSGGQDVTSWGADVTKELGTRWRLSLGTYYSLYKYDLFTDRERDDVRTWFARVRYQVTDDLHGSLAYEFEDNDLDEFHMLRLEATWRF